MLNHFTAIVKYCQQQQSTLGAEHPKVKTSIENQFHHLKSSFLKMTPTTEDATAILADLGHPSAVFSHDQRMELAEVVTGVSEKTNFVNEQAAMRTQTHLYMYNYLTEGQWSDMLAVEPTSPEGMAVLVEASLDVGLPNPNEKTYKQNVAILTAASRLDIAPQQAHRILEAYKREQKSRREQRKVKKTMSVFPSDVAEFMVVHPTAYSEDAPPVPPPIDVQSMIRNASKELTPGRKSNKAIVVTPSSAIQPYSPPMMTPAPPQFDMQMQQHMVAMMWQQMQTQMQRQQQQQPPPPRGGAGAGDPIPGMTYNIPPPLREAPDTAVEPHVRRCESVIVPPVGGVGPYVPPGPAAGEELAPSTAASSSGRDAAAFVDDMDTDIKECLRAKQEANAKAAAAKAKKAAKAAKSKAKAAAEKAASKASALGADDGSEEAGDDDGDEEEDADDAVVPEPQPKKQKASPPHAVHKKPAMAAPCHAERGGRPELSYKPTPYLNGKIYYSTPKKSFRAYKHVTDLVETACHIATFGSPKKAWAAACTAIEKDPRNT